MAALEVSQKEVDGLVEQMVRKRDLVVKRLQAMPDVTLPESPPGAFYVLPEV